MKKVPHKDHLSNISYFNFLKLKTESYTKSKTDSELLKEFKEFKKTYKQLYWQSNSK